MTLLLLYIPIHIKIHPLENYIVSKKNHKTFVFGGKCIIHHQDSNSQRTVSNKPHWN